MSAKVVMKWDIVSETEAKYVDFVLRELMPGMKVVGFDEIQFWYTVYGDGEKMLVSGVIRSEEEMLRVWNGKEWRALLEKLEDYVTHFSYKFVPARPGFQL